MKQITLTQGKVTPVSDHRFEHFNQWKWHADLNHGNWYAVRIEGTRKIKLHREIMGVTDPTIQVDHKDRDGLNNQDDNLRVATHAQNQHNRRLNKNNTSGFKGVFWDKRRKKYRAHIRVDGKKIWLGDFTDPTEAAKVRDGAAKQYHGIFATTNF